MAYDPPGFFNRFNSLLSKYPRLSSMLGGSDSGTGGSSVGYPDSSLIYGTGQPLYAMDPGQTQGQPLTITEGVQGGGGTLSKASNLLSKGGGLLGKVNPYMAAGSLVLGGIQTLAGLRGLNRLSKEKWPEYEATPELLAAKSRSSQRSKFGFTPEQTSAFKSNLASMLNLDYRNAVNMSGGNLAQAIGSRNQAARLRSNNQFASDDASVLSRNIAYDDQMTDKIQRIQDMRTQAATQRRIMLEQAYGGALRAGTQGIGNYFNLQTALNAA